MYIVPHLSSSKEVGSIVLVANSLKFPDFISNGSAPCASADPEAFFPDRGGTVGVYEIRAAKRICSTCQYRVECLEWALSNREIGIWGGTTELDRKRIRKDRRQIA